MTYGSKDEWITIKGAVVLTTDDAIRIDDGSKLVWLPKSQLEDWPDLGEYGEILLKEWLAMEKGLI